jgi:hypothetical protein
MKILLIEPAKAPRTIGGEDVFLYEPLALEYLAVSVSPDHDVRILNYDYFDFIHTLLPTALPLEDFYEEYYQLLQKAILRQAARAAPQDTGTGSPRPVPEDLPRLWPAPRGLSGL